MPATSNAYSAYDEQPWFFLTDNEARWLAALCDVFIPEDDYPSASQAGVVDFIDMQLISPYGKGEGLYLDGPFPTGLSTQGYQLPYTPSELIRAGIEAARAEADLAKLPLEERVRWVDDLSTRDRPLRDIPAKVLFSELLTLTNQGYFSDPIYLGNHDYAGWKMVGFPGAHVYFTSFVDQPTPRGAPPPMGIAHDASNMPRAPRRIPEGS
ncbi:MAG: gluconate 2-dehydrogenase subunit 3 family protein [Paracoccaceae bacterium]